MSWAAMRKLGTILENIAVPINVIRKNFSTCVLSVMTYGMATMSLTNKSVNKLKTTQRSIERIILEITFRDRIRIETIRRRTGVQ